MLSTQEKDYIASIVEDRIRELFKQDEEGLRLSVVEAYEIMMLTKELKEFKKED